MSKKGMGYARVLGVVSLAAATAIAAVCYVGSLERGVEAKASADRSAEELKQVIREQNRLIEDARRQVELRPSTADPAPAF